APLGVGGGLPAALVGTVENVVVHQSGGVNELEDDGEIEVAGADVAGGAAGEEGEGGAEALAVALDRVGDVAFHGGVEGAGLLADALFHGVKLRIDQLQRGLER